MGMRALPGWVMVVVAAAVAACSSPSPGHEAASAPPPAPPPPVAAPAPAPAAAPAMITDDECRARGGTIVTEQTYAHLRRARSPDAPVTPFRICRIPSPKNDATCRGDGECAGGRCFCTGALARPNPADDPALRALDRTPATGQCSDRALPDGSWFCLVEDGTVRLDGIIVD